MKKLALALATLGLTVSLAAYASAPTGTQSFQVAVPDIKAGFDFTLTGLYLKPTASDTQLFYAETQADGVDTNHYTEPSYSPAFSLGIGYAFKNSGNDVRLNWTHLNSSDSDSTTGVLVIPNLHDPFNANSTVKFKYDAVDLDFGQYLNLGTHLQTRWFAGARFARINEDQNALFSAVAVDFPATHFLTNSSKFTGIGPRVGVDGNYYMGKGFGFVTQLAASLLAGRVDSNTTWVDIPRSVGAPSQNRIVPALDGKLGIDYSKALHNGSHFTLEAGYQITEYFNALDRDTNAWVDTSHLVSSNGTTSSNFGFQGPYLSVKYKMA
jgi:hypothetical protein